jgi:hypothetical protein
MPKVNTTEEFQAHIAGELTRRTAPASAEPA